MRPFLFQRPREKLIAGGASSLKTVELLQIIIGSGTVSISSASIAQKVNSVIMSEGFENVSYDTLQRIPGIGNAKACLIIASIELGGRVNSGARLSSSHT